MQLCELYSLLLLLLCCSMEFSLMDSLGFTRVALLSVLPGFVPPLCPSGLF
jgi:hypothetical protein